MNEEEWKGRMERRRMERKKEQGEWDHNDSMNSDKNEMGKGLIRGRRKQF